VEIGKAIRSHTSWPNLPCALRDYFGNSQENWKRKVVSYSLQYELPWASSFVRQIVPDERRWV
jgi:hypothetical protein